MSEHVRAVVVGMGPGGEVVADRLLDAGLDVTVVEADLIGGDCGYRACIPSKTVLRGVEVLSAAERVPGVDGTRLSWEAMRSHRDDMIRHLDDHRQVDAYLDKGARVIKGRARVDGPGRVVVGDEVIDADHIVLATGTVPVVPDVEGLEAERTWTSGDVYTAAELPSSVAIVGGSAVGIETATFLAGYGTQVTLVHRGDRLLDREDPAVGDLARQHLEAAGVKVATGVEPRRGHTDGTLELDDGSVHDVSIVVFATGRRPNTTELGVESAGGELDDKGAVRVDESCRAAPGLWAVGDVNAVMPFTHVSKYQGRIVSDCILGQDRSADYYGIPRVVFAEPEIAAVGLTLKQAEERGLRTVSSDIDITEATARPVTYETEPRGRLGLLADLDADVLVGAWAVAPLSGEWIHWAALAIRARIPIDTLLDQVAQFPTYVEAYLAGLSELERS